MPRSEPLTRRAVVVTDFHYGGAWPPVPTGSVFDGGEAGANGKGGRAGVELPIPRNALQRSVGPARSSVLAQGT